MRLDPVVAVVESQSTTTEPSLALTSCPQTSPVLMKTFGNGNDGGANESRDNHGTDDFPLLLV